MYMSGVFGTPGDHNGLIYMHDVKSKYFYINFTSHSCIELMYNVLMYLYILLFFN